MRLLARLSITARITIGSFIVAAILVAAGAIVVQVAVGSILHSATTTLLHHDASPYLEAIDHNATGPVAEPGDDQLVAVVAPDGKVVESSLPDALEDRIHRLLKQGDAPESVATDKAHYLVLTEEVENKQGQWNVISARNVDATALVLGRVQTALVIGSIVLVLALTAASWLLSVTALRPVTRMRRKAETLADERSDELLPVGTARDELFALATTLNDLIGALRAAAAREKQLVSDASHELRTPIAVLQSQLELTELTVGDERALGVELRAAQATVARLGLLATNLLELSRLEAAPATGECDWGELTAELADAIDRARLLSADRPVSIDFRRGSPVDGRVALSAADVGRILDNLLRNAVAVTPDGGWILAEVTGAPDGVRLVVTDSGPGMPEAFVPVALDRFTRADESRGSFSGGGLGLAIVSALVASAGGSIALANVADAGLRVTIELPLHPVPERKD